MADNEKTSDERKEKKPDPQPTTELKTKWLTDSVDPEHKVTVLKEDKKK